MHKNPTGTVLYTVEQTIKEYRKLSQKNIEKVVSDITVDQCLVLLILKENSNSSQKEIADLIFKDKASITRIVDLMMKKDYLTRETNESDKRRFDLKITSKGTKTLELLSSVIKGNRETALNDFTQEEIATLDRLLHKIVSNCKNQ